MAIGQYPDRVKETTTTTGTGSVTLAGAATGYRSFSSGLADGTKVDYCIVQQDGSEWEVGEGTFTSPSTLSRDTVYSNHNSTTSLISFSAGTKDVFVTLPGSDIDRMKSGGQVLALSINFQAP